MQNIVIFGCGGFGREVLQIILDQNSERPRWHVKGFLVDPGFDAPSMVHGYPVYTTINDLGPIDDLATVVAIGNPAARRNVVAQLTAKGITSFPVLVHPKAWLGTNITLNEGVIICAGALLTTDIVLGSHCQVHVGATVGHDTVVGGFSTISPGANVSGWVIIDEAVEVGSGACLNPGVTLGAGSIIGAAAAVVRNIPAGCTAVGVPARVIRDPLAKA
jgi:sugar O-acyltransferase (sialic acid O-acetyltransferase NeuD family)